MRMLKVVGLTVPTQKQSVSPERPETRSISSAEKAWISGRARARSGMPGGREATVAAGVDAGATAGAGAVTQPALRTARTTSAARRAASNVRIISTILQLSGHDWEDARRLVEQRKESHQVDLAAIDLHVIAEQGVLDARRACHHLQEDRLGQCQRRIGICDRRGPGGGAYGVLPG